MRKVLWPVVIVCVIGLCNIMGCKGKQEEAKPKTIADIKELIEVKCTGCHFSSRIFEKKQSVSKWADVVNRMRSRNPDMISEEEVVRITKHLQANNSVPDEPGSTGNQEGEQPPAEQTKETNPDSPESYE